MKKTHDDREQTRTMAINEARNWKKEMGFELEPNAEIIRIEDIEGCDRKKFVMVNSKLAIPVEMYLSSKSKVTSYTEAKHENLFSNPLCPCCQSADELEKITAIIKQLKSEGKIEHILWDYGAMTGVDKKSGVSMISPESYIPYAITAGLQQEVLEECIGKRGFDFSHLRANDDPGIAFITVKI